MTSVWYWYVSLQVECFGTLRFSEMQVPFFSFWWYHLMLVIFFKFSWFFDRFLMFLRCKDNFGYFGLMLVCSTMDGGLELFFRTRYHIFARVSICVTTHVTILLSEFCTVSNALLLLAHYYIGHSMPYYTFSVE